MQGTKEERRRMLYAIASEIISNFVDLCTFSSQQNGESEGIDHYRIFLCD